MTPKLSYLNSLETRRAAAAEVSDKKKFFVTFPYPYMNGKLHLGHLFSVSKSDFLSYFREMQGYNVLFPFAFHCTGMPISASAKKLREELEGNKVDLSVRDIITGFGMEDVEAFTDPLHWIRTFPALCKTSLEAFHSNIDWRRSFITTDLNKYYDSFVKWQFNRLREVGLLSFGKRHSIFCPIDQQPCLDHDRRKGENVKPVGTVLVKMEFDGKVLLGRSKPGCVPGKAVFARSRCFVEFGYNGKIYFAEKDVFENISAQVNGVEKRQETTGDAFEGKVFSSFGRGIKSDVIDKDIPCVVKEIKGEEDDAEIVRSETEALERMESTELALAETEHLLMFYEPEDEVISRSGGRCVVALTDQWYINYCDTEWKKKVTRCVECLECTSDTRTMLEDAVGWINKWGFSRSFGLGTRIPWDPEYLIDSLSDSTIYMAIYTFKHLLYEDLEGQKEIFPSDRLSDDVWNYIFLNKSAPADLAPFEGILKECRQSFNYFYPVDIRVSGKDLLKNHLIFFLFNHVALFEEKHWPRRIFTNGHLMLNSEKMSKSSGNFLTVDDAIRRFGVSSTRMCLAVCGDTNEDANFVESNANAFTLKLHSYVKSVEELCSEDGLETPKTYDESLGFADKYLLQVVSQNISAALDAHENMVYRDVVKYAFYEMTHAKEMYLILGGSDKSLLFLLYKATTQLLYPIIPSLARHLITTHFHSDFSLPVAMTCETREADAVLYLKNTLKKLVGQKGRKKTKGARILVGVEYAEWKRMCMSVIDRVRCECAVLDISISTEMKKSDSQVLSKTVDAVREVLREFGIPEKRGLLFSMDYLSHPENYAMRFSEYEVLDAFKYYIAENTGLDVSVCVSPKADPGLPLFEFE